MDHHHHLMEELATLCAKMDQAYDKVAKQCGFVCNGCEESCCQTRFFHHTLAEYLYLKEGLARFSDETRQQLAARAAAALGSSAVLSTSCQGR